MNTKSIYTWVFIVSIITLLLILIPHTDNILIDTLRMIFGSIFILFIPWFITTRSFFDDNEIDILERWALSFAISIAIIPLISFYINLAGIPINQISIFIIVLSVIFWNISYTLVFKKWKTI